MGKVIFSRASLSTFFFTFMTPIYAAPPVSTPSQGDVTKAASHFVHPFLNELDCENVGYVQVGEVDEHFFPIFNVYDIDKSKSLSRKEVLGDRYIKNHALQAVSFDLMDANKDEKITPQEMRVYLVDALKLLDGDGDDDVFPAEFEYAYSKGEILVPVKNKEPAKPVANAQKVEKTSRPTIKSQAKETKALPVNEVVKVPSKSL